MSWAWSYVPSVSTIIGPLEENPDTSMQQLNSLTSSPPENIQLMIGVYFDEFTLTFKLTQHSSSQQQQHHQQQSPGKDNYMKNYTFLPFLSCNLKGSIKNNYSLNLYTILETKTPPT